MSQDEGLKAFEAALAALVPRGDRLDRDRLMFLAGQASHGTKGTVPFSFTRKPGQSPGWRWAWPAAFSAMTAVAATLLVIVVARPGPQVIVRTVPAPLEVAPGLDTEGDPGRIAPEGPRPESPPGWRPGGSWPGTPGSGPGAAPEAVALAMGPLGRVRSPLAIQRLSNATLAQALDQILPRALGSDGTPSARGTEDGESSYQDLRDAWLKQPGQGATPPGPPILEISPPSGARS